VCESLLPLQNIGDEWVKAITNMAKSKLNSQSKAKKRSAPLNENIILINSPCHATNTELNRTKSGCVCVSEEEMYHQFCAFATKTEIVISTSSLRFFVKNDN
jgi:hypothetical protein